MKKGTWVTSAVAAFAFSAVAHAEPRDDKPFRIGGRIGMNLATISGDDVNDNTVKNRTGIWIGGIAVAQVSPNFAFEIGAGYAQKGTAIRSDLGGGAIIYDVIQVPVAATGIIPVDPKVRLKAFAGPAVSMRVTAKIKRGGLTQDISDEVKQFELGGILGGGVDVMLPSGLLMFDMRYELGFTTLDDTAGESDIKSRVLSLNPHVPG